MTLVSHFYSDPHFGHSNIIKYAGRPFADADEMDAEMEKRYCEEVRDDDVVLWVGDVSFRHPMWTRHLLSRLPGTKILVRGNHDPSVATCLYLGFEAVTEVLHMRLVGNKVTVCHFPPAGTSKDVRYLERRPPKPGSGQYLIHGHTHEKEKMIGRRIHVGVDAWDFRPAPMTAVVGLIVDANPGAIEG